jgi:mRNA-degrading endonuclease RelE of RelBE toxin-antitoxin system
LEVIVSQKIEKRLKKLSPLVRQKFRKALELFLQNPDHPSLNVHKLKGQKRGGKNFAFRISEKRRVKFSNSNGVTKLHEIGSHKEIY